ncbi:MAG TPA: hypothetical protein VG754_05130, partial [Verrucomicrobiae bacterium]|nr:hypothetical protein [Verrucomicrobiae bacterium]
MKSIQGYHLIKPEDLFWRPSNLMQIPNADFLERTGSENPEVCGWSSTQPRSTEASEAGSTASKEAENVPISLDAAPGVWERRERLTILAGGLFGG